MASFGLETRRRLERVEALLKEITREDCLEERNFTRYPDGEIYPSEDHPMKGKKALFRKDN